MGEALSQAGRKLLAVAVLVLVAFLAFKLVVGFVSTLVWAVVLIGAVIAVIWALRVL